MGIAEVVNNSNLTSL